MGYCTVSDIEAKGAHASKPYDTQSKPTLAQVQEFIESRAREIDARLSVVGVTVPVSQATSPKAYALLKEVNALGAASDAQNSSFFRSSAPNATSSSAEHYEERYDTLLLMYAGDGTPRHPGNPKLLQDAVLSSDAPVKPTSRTPWSRTRDLYAPATEAPTITAMPFRMSDEF